MSVSPSRTVYIRPQEQRTILIRSSTATTYVVEREGYLRLCDSVDGRMRDKSIIHVILKGEGAAVDIANVFFAQDSEQLTLAHTVSHEAPHTVSSIRSQGILGGHAAAGYTGRIHIPHGVAGCRGHEESRTLLLSNDAHIDAVPHLEIDNNDVVCGHSVSVTHIDEVKKFYLESRGLSDADVRDLLIQGSCQNVLTLFPDKEQEKIRKRLTKTFHS